jgi:hypothetical protein
MKFKYIKFLLVFLLIANFGCAINKNNRWTPYIGCSEEELYQNWGYGGDSSWYDSKYGSSKNTWYNKALLLGVILPGYSSEPFRLNILVSIKDGIIESVSYH